MANLTILLEGFCIERALSDSSVHEPCSFRQMLDESGQISPTKLSECLNPVLDISQLDGDASYHFDDYYAQSPPEASWVGISNITENYEDDTIAFDVTWVFEDVKVQDIDECLADLKCWKNDIGKYALQLKESICKSYRLRNNRYSSPKVAIRFE